MLHAVIMCGGTGTRFWPASRAARPKQLLRLAGERTMLQMTLDRLQGLVPPERTHVITSASLTEAVREQLPDLPSSAVVGEPCKRDTAPCIGLAALLLNRADADATMLVLPADHVIHPRAQFQAAARQAAALVEAAPGVPRGQALVTFGIPPTYPAEIFGYVERGEPLALEAGAFPAYRVRTFREKPNRQVAEGYVASGSYYWNAGIFVWKARTILAALEQRQPEMMRRLAAIDAAAGKAEFDAILAREFPQIAGISIDYAVMEHAENVLVIEAPFAWDDVGSWQALARLRTLDADGNLVAARHLGLNTNGCIIFDFTLETAPQDARHLIVTLGMRDCLVVRTSDATLVANKHDEEAIRKIVKLLEERGWTQWL